LALLLVDSTLACVSLRQSFFGLDVTELSTEIIEEIDKILPPYWSRSNPIDLVGEEACELGSFEVCEWVKRTGFCKHLVP